MTNKTPLVLSHASALAYWRSASASAASHVCSAQECRGVLDSARGAIHLRKLSEALERAPLSELERPIDLLTSSRNDRRVTSLASYHCIQTNLPDKSLVRISCRPEDQHIAFDVYACSPELCFVQMACTLPVWELIELGYELCGMRNDPAKQSLRAGRAISAQDANGCNQTVSTPEKLQAFTESCPGVTGGKRARQAAKCLVGYSRSLEEAHICMLAFLPRSLGGMGALRPVLGQHIAAPDAAARVLGTRTLTPDLYWPDAGVALEYDGRIWDDANARDEYENRKRNAYRIMGISVVCIGRSDLEHPDKIRRQFTFINQRCGKRLTEPNDRQRARQESLMNWIAGREAGGNL